MSAVTFFNVGSFILDTAANDGGAGNDAIDISASGLVATNLGRLVIDAGTGVNTLAVNGGTANIEALGIGNLALSANGSAIVRLPVSQALSSIGINGTSQVVLSGADMVVKTSALNIAPGARLDLAGNGIVVQATAGTRAGVMSSIANWIVSGRNGGTWDGMGIGNSAHASAIRGLAAILNDGGAGVVRATLGAHAADVNSILIKETWLGDGDLSGQIDGDDYFRMDSGYLGGKLGYLWGDVNYDQAVNGRDYFALDRSFLATHGGGESASLSAQPIQIADDVPASEQITGEFIREASPTLAPWGNSPIATPAPGSTLDELLDAQRNAEQEDDIILA